MTQTFVLPWPPKELSPNARLHYMAVHKAKRAYRHNCAWQVVAQGGQKIAADKLHVSLTFYPPNRRAFDLDGLLSRMKSGLDGLADVIGVDDKHWSLTIQRADTIGGMVRVEVSA